MNADKVNILMVDDQPAKLLSYEAILAPLREMLLKAGSAREALELLLKHEIAVVLVDVNMPEINGFDLADMIRQHPRFQSTPIIFISAIHMTDRDRLKGYEHGAIDYVAVPVIPEMLRSKVRVLADLHRKNRELAHLNSELEARVAERTWQLQRNSDLLELATEAVIVRDWQGRVEYWNSGAETVYGWRREEMRGKMLHEILQTRFPSSASDVQSALKGSGRWGGNLVQTTRDGREITVACRKVLNQDSAGRPLAVLEIGRDLTGQLQTEEALRKSERLAAMGRMAGIIAHEINNPLAAITNAFFLLRDHPTLDEHARRYAQIADHELARVARITSKTLSFYKEPQESVAVSIVSLLDETLDLHECTLQLAHVTVEREYETEGEVSAFPAELKQVFLNLITNAIEAMTQGGRLRICVRNCKAKETRRPGICVSFVDTGSGVRPEHAKNLFEPFFSTKSEKGTGLGLWISKGIITKYEGKIRFRTLRIFDGHVTCFSVFLPASGSKERNGQRAENKITKGDSLPVETASLDNADRGAFRDGTRPSSHV
jgi:two-component system, NtrC family, sensor kinase